MQEMLPAVELQFDYISRDKKRRCYILLDDDPQQALQVNNMHTESAHTHSWSWFRGCIGSNSTAWLASLTSSSCPGLSRLLLLPSCFKCDVTLRTTFTALLVHFVQWSLCTRYSFTTETNTDSTISLFFRSCFKSQGIKPSWRQLVHVYAAA